MPICGLVLQNDEVDFRLLRLYGRASARRALAVSAENALTARDAPE